MYAYLYTVVDEFGWIARAFGIVTQVFLQSNPEKSSDQLVYTVALTA
jgi:hypothetical protein